MKVDTYWARDEEYHLPYFRKVTRKIIQTYALTGRRRHDPKEEKYANGIYWSRQWEYPFAAGQIGTPDKARVLDVGCGTSPFLVYLGQNQYRAYGSDPGLEGPDGLWGHDENFGAPHIIEIRRESMSSLSWEDDYFDYVTCLSVLEHIESSKEVVAGVEGMKRVLKPGGKLLLTVDDVGNGIRSAMLAIGVFTEGCRFEGHFDWEAPETKYPYSILSVIMEK